MHECFFFLTFSAFPSTYPSFLSTLGYLSSMLKFLQGPRDCGCKLFSPFSIGFLLCAPLAQYPKNMATKTKTRFERSASKCLLPLVNFCLPETADCPLTQIPACADFKASML